MAKKKRRSGGLASTSKIETRSFTKGMIKDLNQGLMSEGAYINARNAVNNSIKGDLGIIANEASNILCTLAPYTVIGAIHITGTQWAIFSTDDVDSEVGRFDEELCTYETVVNDPCLNFKKANPIIGESKENFDCTRQVYWADGLNPDRSLNLDNVPWIQNCITIDDCVECTDTTQLDCDAIRLARLSKNPCISIEAGPNGGEILNGTYFVVMAYTENEQRITDYSLPSNKLSLFNHDNVNGSIDVVIENTDPAYDELELVIVGFVNQQLVARRAGIYSTRQGRVSFDRINPEWPAVPLEFLPLDKPAYERSEGIYRNGDYLLRVAPTTKFSFNYQPLANQITTNWVGVEYPARYYRDQGTNVGYLRDEVYAFFIRWVYNTDDRSEDYHIPGRGPALTELDNVASAPYGSEQRFEAENTAQITQGNLYANLGTTDDGGIIRARGTMGYWQSTEKYPDDNPDVWDQLCGKNIRHHKMPDNDLINHFSDQTGGIVVLGVQFSNIAPPVDNQGNPIPGIVGYEILRGSREGNKTVVAKGLLNNMGLYKKRDGSGIAYYQNYPYNDLRRDPFLTSTRITSDDIPPQGTQLGGPNYQRDKFTFHSPDTQFKQPFLSAKEVKIYETLWGVQDLKFNQADLHPKHIIITDLAFWMACLVGFGAGILAMQGGKKTRMSSASPEGTFVGTGSTNVGTAIPAIVAAGTANGALLTNQLSSATGLDVLTSITTGGAGDNDLINSTTFGTAIAAITATPSLTHDFSIEWDSAGGSGLPIWLSAFQAIPSFITFWGQGADKFLDVVKAFSKFRQFAITARSHCFHNKKDPTHYNTRVGILNSSYIDSEIQEFGGIEVNNIYRTPCVGILTGTSDGFPLSLPDPNTVDTSRKTLSQTFGAITPSNNDNLDKLDNTSIASAHYVGLKQRLRNQYGQLESVRRLPASTCTEDLIDDPSNPGKYISSITYGGDTYIGRYTEKNTFFYFYDWLENQPDNFEYDYRLKDMIPFASFWMDTEDFQINDFFGNIFSSFGGGNPTVPGSGALPSQRHNFDRGGAGGGSDWQFSFVIKAAYMYLFNSGVRDFFVESEVNVEYRDWGDLETERHYDPYQYTTLNTLFHQRNIRAVPFFKYDYSLSVGRLYQFFPSWSAGQFRNYNPQVAETCYSYYPDRLIYSLPQNQELRYDNWRSFLVNNFKDFSRRITAVDPVGRNGAMILFEREAPVQFLGVDTLQSSSGTEITIGDGGLFNQPLQNLVNADESFEYGSCQNRLSVTNTPAGVFWISVDQGKIFQYAGKLNEISQNGMRWWFEEFLPYKLTEDYPDFELTDNTIVGIGCQTIYNNSTGVVYFCKRDFKVKPEWKDRIIYLNDSRFIVDRVSPITLGDPRYFDDASWTISYDPKTQAWISFHDWHPNLLLPAKNDFVSILDSGIWKHNDRSDSYCNFYGVDYPFEVEMVTPTGQAVNTLKSVEYMMEALIYDENGVDRHHALDFNFDEAVLYNTEQISGLLRLNLTPKNNAPELITYPRVNPTNIDILYSKEEQKYRFNQFWDITDDRGEFTTARRLLWNTEVNGYIKNINPLAINYSKPLFERKKFRHYQSNLLLRRRVCGPHNMQLKLVNSKNQFSMR